MDTSAINSQAVTTEGGFHFGDPNAPVKVVEYINLRCPYSKMWWENSAAVLDEYERNGQVERIVKHFDKEKPGLDKGNVLHSYLDYSNHEQARKDIDHYVAHMDEWGNLTKEDVARYAEDKTNATRQNNTKESEAIVNETVEANVKFVPTVVIGSHIFDENISDEELRKIIEEELSRNQTAGS